MISSWSNDKLRGQTLMEIDESDIHGKLSKQSNDLDLRLEKNPCSKISKNPRSSDRLAK